MPPVTDKLLLEQLERSLAPASGPPVTPEMAKQLDIQMTAPSSAERFGFGMADPIYGTAQLAARIRPPGMGQGGFAGLGMTTPPALSKYAPATPDYPLLGPPEQVDRIVKQREDEYNARRREGRMGAAGEYGVGQDQLDTDWWRLGGNVASPANFIPIGPPGAGLGARAAMGAVRGAAAGAEQPVTSDNFWTTKGEQTGVGAVLGAAFEPVASAVAGKVKPVVQTLIDAGMNLTPGQSGGAIARLLETLSGKIPFVKGLVTANQGKAIESFNPAIWNQALAPIGKSLPKGAEPGFELNTKASDLVDEFYHDLMPRLSYDPNGSNTVIDAVAQAEKNLAPGAQRNDFYNRIASIWDAKTGDALKDLDKKLGYDANRYIRSQDPAQQDLGTAIQDVRNAVRQRLGEMNPEAKADLDAADKAFAQMRVLQNAAAKNPATGIFTPRNVLATTGQGNYGASQGRLAEGGALLQPFAAAAENVVGSRIGGKAPLTASDLLAAEAIQALFTGGAIGGGGSAVGAQSGALPEWAKWGAAAALPALMFTRPGQTLLSGFAPAGVVRRSFGGLLGSGPAAAAGDLLNRY